MITSSLSCLHQPGLSRHENVDHQCHVTKFRGGEAVHAGPSLEPLRLDSGPNLHDAAERQLFIVKLTFVETAIYIYRNGSQFYPLATHCPMTQCATNTDFPIYHEVYMEEEGKFVAMAATLDTENYRISTNRGNLPKEYL